VTDADTTPASELDQAYADRSAGQSANIAANASAWRDGAHRVEVALAVLARAGHPFTASSVESTTLADGAGDFDKLLIASCMGTWSRAGKIRESFDQRPVRSLRRSRHGALLRWWIGTAAAAQSEAA
jgi:hypothetical protein